MRGADWLGEHWELGRTDGTELRSGVEEHTGRAGSSERHEGHTEQEQTSNYINYRV